jgi:large subunit ribosomal protein L10
LNRDGKKEVIAELAGKLASTKAAFLADYRGLNVVQVEKLRNELRTAGVDYRVIAAEPDGFGMVSLRLERA